jgi:hypothetical protein
VLVEVPAHDSDGRIISGQKTRVQMESENFNGQEQFFYYSANYELAGQFKEMAAILTEQGINIKLKLAKCKRFKCAPSKQDY